MATNLTVSLLNEPGTLLRASDALGRAGINIQGACGYLCDGHGTFHVLVDDAERARRALIDAGLEVQDERQVVTTEVEDRPGSAAAVLRRVADAKLNIDLLYVTADKRLVLAGDDIVGIRAALLE
jgi:hypothetical protein